MSTFCPDASELILISALFKDSSNEALTLKLFSSNTTPSQSTILSDLTEATGVSGYSAISLSRAGWSSPSTVSNKAVIQYSSAQTFSFTGSGTIYGFYLVGTTSGALWYVERFATSRSVTSGTDLSVTPKISLANDDS